MFELFFSAVIFGQKHSNFFSIQILSRKEFFALPRLTNKTFFKASKFFEETVAVATLDHGDGDVIGRHVRHEDSVLVVLNLCAPKIWRVPLSVLVHLLGLVLRVGLDDLRRRHDKLFLAELLQSDFRIPLQLLVGGGVVAAAGGGGGLRQRSHVLVRVRVTRIFV